MAYRVDQKNLLSVEYLVDDSEVSDSEFAEPRQIAAQGLRSDWVVVRCHPAESSNDASRLRFVEPRQVAGRGIQKTNRARSRLAKAKSPDYIFKRFASLAARHLAPLAQESSTDRAPDGESVVRVAEQLHQLLLNGVPEHLLELLLGHSSYTADMPIIPEDREVVKMQGNLQVAKNAKG